MGRAGFFLSSARVARTPVRATVTWIRQGFQMLRAATLLAPLAVLLFGACTILQPIIEERPAAPTPTRRYVRRKAPVLTVKRTVVIAEKFSWDATMRQSRPFPSIDATAFYKVGDGASLGRIGVSLRNHCDRVVRSASMAVRVTYNDVNFEFPRLGLPAPLLPGNAAEIGVVLAKQFGKRAGVLDQPTARPATLTVFDVPVVIDDLGNVTKLANLSWQFVYTPGRSYTVTEPIPTGKPTAPVSGGRATSGPAGARQPGDGPGADVGTCNALCTRAVSYYQESEGAQRSRAKICMRKCIKSSRVEFRKCLGRASDRATLYECEGL